MKNLKDPLGIRTRDLPFCSAVSQQTATSTPIIAIYIPLVQLNTSFTSRSPWPRRWRRGPGMARLLGLRVRILPGSCLLWVFCSVTLRFLWRADHSSEGVLTSVMCLSTISKPQQWLGRGPRGLSKHKYIHSFGNLSDDRSKASSKTKPPHSAF